MLLSKYYSRDQIIRLRWARREHVYGREELLVVSWWGNLREGRHFKDIDGSIILKVS